MWLVKSEEESSYGKSPDERAMEELISSSVVVIDKNSGPTSHQISSWAREIFQVNKAGHVGTLDPHVTGVLPVALGNAVKAMPVLSGLDKEYIGSMHLHKDVPDETLRTAVANFIGVITQTPPKKSAVARRPREREIKFFDVIEIQDRDVLFHVGCEAGTYIRKLVSDLGLSMGIGAHMSELRRIKVGDFNESQSHSLLKIKDAYQFWKEGNDKQLRQMLIPVEHAIDHVKKVFVKDSAVDAIANGSPVYVNGITRAQKGIIRGEMIAVFTLKSELISLSIAKMTSEEMCKRQKGIAARTDRVFISKGIYPNWK